MWYKRSFFVKTKLFDIQASLCLSGLSKNSSISDFLDGKEKTPQDSAQFHLEGS